MLREVKLKEDELPSLRSINEKLTSGPTQFGESYTSAALEVL